MKTSTLRLGALASAHATSNVSENHLIERQQGIENALTMALYFIRQPGNAQANLWAATARTHRALTLLKHSSELATQKGGV